MNKLYFVRHGESFSNTGNTFSTKQGASGDRGLTTKGRRQVQSGIKNALTNGLRTDLIISSPLKRAQETSTIVAKELNFAPKDIVTVPLLVELQFGELEGTPWDTFWGIGKTYADLSDYTDAETIEQLQQRAAKALEYLHSRSEDVILVVSHSAFGRALIRVIEKRPYTDEFDKEISQSLTHGEVLALI